MTTKDERECFAQRLLDWGKGNPKVLNIIITYSPNRAGVISAIEISLITPDVNIRAIPGVKDLKLSMVVGRVMGILKEELEEVLNIMNELKKIYNQCLREVG